MRFATYLLFFAAMSQAAPVFTLQPGQSVNATLEVPLDIFPSEIFLHNAEWTFLGALGGITIACTNCADDPIRSYASFLWNGFTPGYASNYIAYVPNPPLVETYDLTLTLQPYVPHALNVWSVSEFQLVENPEPGTWMLLTSGLAFLLAARKLRAR